MDKKQLLWEFADLLESNHISFCLLFGTLLGAYRDKQFLPWDLHDVDIGIADEDYWKVRKIIDSSEFKYKYIWRKEISVYKNKEDLSLHIDIYPLERKDNKVYIYSYKVNRRYGNRWTDEWRLSTPEEFVFPFSRINFLGRMFYAPYSPENWFKVVYGSDWQTPKQYPCTTYDICSTKDEHYNQMDDVTAIVTTYKRPGSLCILLESITKYYPNLKILVGYQDKEIPTCSMTFKNNITWLQLPEDCGVSYARNELTKQVKTKYTLLLDDDFIFNEKTYIEKLLEVFVANESIRIVAGRLEQNGQIRKYERCFAPVQDNLILLDWEYLQSKHLVDYQYINSTKYGLADIVFLFFIAETDYLKLFKWDEEHKIHSEHLDYFLHIFQNGNIWRFTSYIAFNPDVTVYHNPVIPADLKPYRDRMYYNLIYTKYGYKKGYCVGENALINYYENKKENII